MSTKIYSFSTFTSFRVIRPPNDSRQVVVLCFLTFITFNLQARVTAAGYERLGHKLNLFNSLRHFAHPSPNFYIDPIVDLSQIRHALVSTIIDAPIFARNAERCNNQRDSVRPCVNFRYYVQTNEDTIVWF